MVQVRFDFRSPDGGAQAVTVQMVPIRRLTAATNVVLPAPYHFAVSGVRTVDVIATNDATYSGEWCWRIIELTDGGMTRHVRIPSSSVPLEYASLVDVDPATFAPLPAPQTVADELEELRELIGAGGGSGAVESVNGKTGAVTLSAADVGAATTTQLAGKADLIGGVIPTSQIPAIALTQTVQVATEAAMLALTANQVQPGDVAVRADGAGSFMLQSAPASTLTNWVLLNAPTDQVSSVNGQIGTVVLGKSDVGLGSVDNTSDANKPVSSAQALAISSATALRGTARTLSGTLSLVANGAVQLPWGAALYDEGGFTSGLATNQFARIPAGMGGRYRIDVRLVADGPTNAGLAVVLYINGTGYRELPMLTNAGGTQMVSTGDIVSLAEGATLTGDVYANASGAKLISTGIKTTQMILTRVS